MTWRPGRRDFIKNGTLVLAATQWTTYKPLVKDVCIGMVTDLHYADKPSAGSRFYRRSPEKLREAANIFNERKLDFVVELGDLVDAAETIDQEKRYVRTINKLFKSMAARRHYVLGNHCVATLTKSEFLAEVEQEKSFYSFDHGGVHFIVLDSCFRGDGVAYERGNFEWTDPNIPAEQMEWLQGDLNDARGPVIVFAHQRLDVANHYVVKNAAAVRKLLSDCGRVLAVFQGHSHRNNHQLIDGIHYCTLVAMVEGNGLDSNGYSILTIKQNGTLLLDGFRKQEDYRWQP